MSNGKCFRGSIGVQQSQLPERIEHLLCASPINASFPSSKLIRVKLTGDGTNIGKLHVVTFDFTVPEDGMGSKAAAGNHPLCIIKDTEDYEQLNISLSGCFEGNSRYSHGLHVQGTTFKIDFLLGGDWKFLACICGLYSASSSTRAFGAFGAFARKLSATLIKNGLSLIKTKEHGLLRI